MRLSLFDVLPQSFGLYKCFASKIQYLNAMCSFSQHHCFEFIHQALPCALQKRFLEQWEENEWCVQTFARFLVNISKHQA